jgi:NADP-dependent 3-hydroxy acid dehydrogenase YdfG
VSQTVVITGASAGIGRAAAELFGSRGARVALVARGEDGLRGAADAVEYRGGTALPLPTDVADFEAASRSDAAVALFDATAQDWHPDRVAACGRTGRSRGAPQAPRGCGGWTAG